MDFLEQLKQALLNAMYMLFDAMAVAVPRIILVLVLLLAGWLIGKTVKGIILRALKIIRFQQALDKVEISPILAQIGIKNPPRFLASLGYWVVMLVFLIAITEVVRLPILSEGIASILGYVPKLLSAMVILIFGMLLAGIIQRVVRSACESINLSGAKVIANIVYYILFVFIAITALNQTGIDTTVITSNVTLIFAALLLAFAISYGFASRGLMTNMLSAFYRKEKFREGMRIRVGDVEGVIEEIDSISVTLVQKKERLYCLQAP